MQETIKNRSIFCHDNLEILQGINSESIDLIYLDPPFNKKKEFAAPLGSASEGALKDTGSFYLHCDPTMSHYLKILLDIIFGASQFINEIIWCYKWGGTNSKRLFKKKHDVILRYSKSNNYIFNVDNILQYGDTSGWSGAERGRIPNDWWADIPSINTQAKENTKYPTQKPLALIERIITASSNTNNVVLDPFCGCATTCVAAEKLNRQWIGIDISIKAYELVKHRLKNEIANPEDLFEWDKEIEFKTSPPKRTDRGADARADS